MNQREKDLGPNDAPSWYSSDEASAWACGAEYGRKELAQKILDIGNLSAGSSASILTQILALCEGHTK